MCLRYNFTTVNATKYVDKVKLWSSLYKAQPDEQQPEVLLTFILCWAVIGMHNIVENLRQSQQLSSSIAILYNVGKTCVMKYMIVFFHLLIVSLNIIHLSESLTIASSIVLFSVLRKGTRRQLVNTKNIQMTAWLSTLELSFFDSAKV